MVSTFECDYCKKYTKVSFLLKEELNKSLLEIEKFYYSNFWERRFKRRIKEEDLKFNPIELSAIQGSISYLKEDTEFKMFDEDPVQNGISNKGTMIALNTNLNDSELNESHINNVIMHEFGHRQYNQPEFKIVVELNKRIIGTPGLYIKNNEILSKQDYKYFMDHNELRQRIIPIIKEMRDNNWTLLETYYKSNNLKIDDIKDIFERSYILKLIDNLL